MQSLYCGAFAILSNVSKQGKISKKKPTTIIKAIIEPYSDCSDCINRLSFPDLGWLRSSLSLKEVDPAGATPVGRQSIIGIPSFHAEPAGGLLYDKIPFVYGLQPIVRHQRKHREAHTLIRRKDFVSTELLDRSEIGACILNPVHPPMVNFHFHFFLSNSFSNNRMRDLSSSMDGNCSWICFIWTLS